MAGTQKNDLVYTQFEQVQTGYYSGSQTPPPSQPIQPCRRYSKRRSCLSSWYLETVSLLCGAASIGALTYILTYMQDQPLEKWPYSFPSFSAMIAILATIAEFTLIFPTSKSISQLKWVYIREPRPVQRLQDYDLAARGPLGALKFIGKFLLHPILLRPEMLGALIIAASVSMNTVSQQIFSLYPLDVLRENNTAVLGVMTEYNTHPARGGAGTPNAPALDTILQGAFLKSMYNLSISPEFECQSKACKWPDQYYTLGFDADCTDVTEATLATKNCSIPESGGTITCNLTTPGGVNLWWQYATTMIRVVASVNALPVSYYQPGMRNVTSEIIRVAEYRVPGVLEELANETLDVDKLFDPAVDTITECGLHISAHRIGSITATGNNLAIGTREVIALGEATLPRDISNSPVDGPLVWNGTADGRPDIKMDRYDLYSIQQFLNEQLGNITAAVGDEANFEDGKSFGLNIPLGKENATGITEWLPHAALAMTNQVMSSTQSARQNITGLSTESIIHVRIVWGWLTLPVFEVVGAMLLLFVTVLRSQMLRGVPQWKDSSTAILFHKIEDDRVNKVKVLEMKVSGESDMEAQSKAWMVHAPAQS